MNQTIESNIYQKNCKLIENKEKLIEDYLPYVRRIVSRIAIHLPQNIEIDELINAGVIGLIQATEKFDSSRDSQFKTYAVFRIKGAVLNELRSRDHLSRSYRKKIRELDNTYHFLERKYGREIEDDEVADSMGLDIDEYYRIKSMSSISFVSFEEIYGIPLKQNEDINELFFKENRGDALSLTKLKEIKKGLAEAIDELPEKEKLVISLYYLEELTMKETGKILDITESRVSQIHSKAIIHLREKLRKKGLLES